MVIDLEYPFIEKEAFILTTTYQSWFSACAAGSADGFSQELVAFYATLEAFPYDFIVTEYIEGQFFNTLYRYLDAYVLAIT